MYWDVHLMCDRTVRPRTMDRGFKRMSDLKQIVDVDSHEMTPVEFWEGTFGPASSEIGRILEPLLLDLAKSGHANQFSGLGIEGDEMPIDANTVWNVKGPLAPGAFDMG